jgi:peptide-methionine (R)-S-oxide reductase
LRLQSIVGWIHHAAPEIVKHAHVIVSCAKKGGLLRLREVFGRSDMHRRHLLVLSAVSLLALLPRVRRGVAKIFEISKTEAEWKAALTPEQYAVMREEATERPWTSALLDEHRKGVFACAACDLPLYDAATKFDSGTGWPSFFDVLPNAVGKKVDDALFTTRTEVHCRRCGGHLGHVFEDGPPPTGLRYCMNGAALQFHASAGAS